MRKITTFILALSIALTLIPSGCKSENKKYTEYKTQYEYAVCAFMNSTSFIDKSTENEEVLEYAYLIDVTSAITYMGDFLNLEKPAEKDKDIENMVIEIFAQKEALTQFLKQLRKLDELSAHISIDRDVMVSKLTEQEQKDLKFALNSIRTYRSIVENSRNKNKE